MRSSGSHVGLQRSRPIPTAPPLIGPLCQCASVCLSHVCGFHRRFRRKYSHDKVRIKARTAASWVVLIFLVCRVHFDSQRGGSDDHRSTFPYLRLRNTWVGPGKHGISICRRPILLPLTCHEFQVSANLVEPGENVLVLNTGYFGDSFADWCAYIRNLCPSLLTLTVIWV